MDRDNKENSLNVSAGDNFKGSMLLLITSIIWGLAFVAQSAGMDYVGPFTFMFTRFLLGGAVLLPVIFFMSRSEKKSNKKTKHGSEGADYIQNEKTTVNAENDVHSEKSASSYPSNSSLNKKENHARETGMLIKGGLTCGALLCSASAFQQVGIQYTTVGKAGFITAMYILIVPLLGLFFGKKPPAKIWFCVALAIIGLYFLLMGERVSIGAGDALCMVCAVIFATQIMAVDYFVTRVNGVKLACMEFFTTAVISGILMLIFEEPTLSGIIAGKDSILYAGLLSSGVGYTLQILGQKYTRPAVASLLMSLESVFAALAGAAILGQIPSHREIFGCILVFAAIILAQLPTRNGRKNEIYKIDK